MRISVADRAYRSGLTMQISVLDSSGNVLSNTVATEWSAGTGVYYIELNTKKMSGDFLIMAWIVGETWRASHHIVLNGTHVVKW